MIGVVTAFSMTLATKYLNKVTVFTNKFVNIIVKISKILWINIENPVMTTVKSLRR